LRWTQQELAYHTQLALRTISVYESDDAPERLDILIRFANIAAARGFSDLIAALLESDEPAAIAARTVYEAAASRTGTRARIERVFRHLDEARKCVADLKDGECIIEVPTGAGKTVTFAAIMTRLLSELDRAESELKKAHPAA